MKLFIVLPVFDRIIFIYFVYLCHSGKLLFCKDCFEQVNVIIVIIGIVSFNYKKYLIMPIDNNNIYLKQIWL